MLFVCLIVLFVIVSRIDSLLIGKQAMFRLKYSTSRSLVRGLGVFSATTTLHSTLAVHAEGRANPLMIKDKSGLPKFEKITPADVQPALEHHLSKLQTSFQDFEKTLQDPTKLGSAWGRRRLEYDYEMVIEENEKIQSDLSSTWGVVGHLMGVKNSDDLRAAHDAMQGPVIEAYQKIGQSKPLFKALTALKERQSVWKDLDDAQRRIIDSSLRQMKTSGVGLEGADKERFNALQLEVAELSTKFSNNVLDATKAFKLRLTNKEDVDGLPSSALAAAAQFAVAQGEAATPENGPWIISLDMPSYLPAMQHLKSRDLREKLYKAYVTRASSCSETSKDKDNEPIIRRILQVKKEMAQLLGYNNYAELSLASKMADSVDSVLALSEMLLSKAYPAAQKELEELKAFAKSKGFNDELALWDIPYWSERLREAQYQFSEEELRPYFAYPNVLEGLFSLIKRLFGVTIKKADGEAEVWHKDVGFFKVFDDATGEHIASFFLDPYSRPGEKRGGAWMDVCVGKSKVMDTKPVAYLTCNGSPPVGDKPSLMTFREIETLFHETGHGLQHLLTSVPHADAAGINNVEWDAVELPSQFMENFCYDRKTLYGFAKHYETGEPLPEALFQKIKDAKNFQAGLALIRQLFFGAMDMTLYSNYDPSGPVSPFEIQQELARKFTVIPPLKDDRFLCSFGHIFAGGYSAGYYSYKWAEVLSADAFAAFEENGLDNEEAVQATGKKFRDTVLAMGGGKHPSDVYRAFRGRDPTPDALLRHAGLVGSKK